MNIKQAAILILASILTLNFPIYQIFATIQTDEIVSLTINDQVMLGEQVEMDITLIEDYDNALYMILVFSPGDLDTLQKSKEDIKEWLINYDWNLHDWIEFKNDFIAYCEAEGIDVAGKLGYLYKFMPSITLSYNDDFLTFCGEPSTLIPGEYDVVILAFSKNDYQYTFDKFGSNFFVIPEIPLGSVMSLFSMIAAVIIRKQRLPRTKNI